MALTVSQAQHDHTHLFVGFVRDLSHQRKIEAQIERLNSERLTAMQGMAAGLAHEINQPLAAGVMYLKAARRLLKIPDERRAASIEHTLDQAAEAMLRAGRIMNRLREFVSGGEPDKFLRRLHELVHAVCKKMTEEGNLSNIELTLELNAGNDCVLIDPVQISQVLINLIRNAAQAMRTSETRRLIVSTELQGKDMICVSVVDTGGGLSDEVRKTLFEPFKTTKETGVGIGLSISRSIIEAHYGKIWAEPNPLGGAIFKFNLPLADDEVL
jgi:C4-dicarboxylate-specific signal transduction histidine kinase